MRRPPPRSLLRDYLPLGIVIGVVNGLLVADWDSVVGVLGCVVFNALIVGAAMMLIGWAFEHRRFRQQGRR